MRRRSKASSEPGKSRRRKTVMPKRRNALKAGIRGSPPATDRDAEVARLSYELHTALEHQAATSEVLQVISSSPGDLKPVFESLLANATRLCGAQFGNLDLREGDGFRIAALHNAPTAYIEWRQRQPVVHITGLPHIPLARIVRTKAVQHIPDLTKDEAYIKRAPPIIALVESAGARSLLSVPMLKEGDVIGAIVIYRQEVRPFTEKQIELITSFARQAVIAIENTRLLNELRQRTDDLGEALKQQTATSEVLQVISSSPGELEPVFQSMLVNATRLCEANFGSLYLCERDTFRIAAMHNAPPAYKELRRSEPVIDSAHPAVKAILGRLANTKEIVQITDLMVAPPVERGALASLAGARSVLAVPMLKENELIGALTIYRQEVRPFTDKQIALLTNFASQAVIAIENARLLNDLRQRTNELTESLEQQTATSEVLRVISSSPGELQPVFQTMLVNAVRLCEAKFGNLFLHEGGTLRIVASHDVPGEFVEARRRRGSYQGTPLGDVVGTKQTVHIPDLAATQAYAERHPAVVEAVELGGIRTVVLVPMLKDNELVGVIAIYRQEVRPFTDRQISLVQNFAAQAVIAIENARLLSELRESLQQQTATADVLKVISRSTFDLQTVLNALVKSAVQLCDAEIAVINRLIGTVYEVAASHGLSPELLESLANIPIEAGRSTISGRAALECEIVHVPDAMDDPEFTNKEWYGKVGSRTMLGVPLLREGIPIGVIVLMRRIVRPFTANQISLATTFADQAVIAIENVRLFEQIQEKTRQLAEASQHKSQFLANMSHELRTPLNAIIGVTEMLREDAEALKQDVEPLDRVLGAGRHLLALINDILDLSKIEAGRMELHLETFPLVPVIKDVVKTIEPMATKNGNRLVIDCPADLGTIHADQTRFRQSLLNLASNANKFTEKGTITISRSPRTGER